MKIIRPVSQQPIPKNAKRVFKGVIFDVYQWEQKMFDGSAAIFEKIRRPDTALIIPVTQDQKFVLIRQDQPDEKNFVGLPGGRVERNETPEQAAKRELLDETGFESSSWSLWHQIVHRGKVCYKVHVYLAKNCIKVSGSNLDAGEKIKVKLISFDEFFQYLLDRSFDPRDEIVDKLLKDGVLTIITNKKKAAEFKKFLLS